MGNNIQLSLKSVKEMSSVVPMSVCVRVVTVMDWPISKALMAELGLIRLVVIAGGSASVLSVLSGHSSGEGSLENN